MKDDLKILLNDFVKPVVTDQVSLHPNSPQKKSTTQNYSVAPTEIDIPDINKILNKFNPGTLPQQNEQFLSELFDIFNKAFDEHNSAEPAKTK